MTFKEKLILVILSLIIILISFNATKIKYYNQFLDSAVFVNNISITKDQGIPNSQINSSAVRYLNHIASKQIEEICHSDFKVPTNETINMLDRHLYLYLFPLSVFNYFFLDSDISAFLHVLTFIGTLIAVYIFLRVENISILRSFLFVFLISMYAGWSEGFYGQYYSAKISMLPITIFCLLLFHRFMYKNPHTISLIILAILICITSERSALMISLFIFSYTLIYRINYSSFLKFNIIFDKSDRFPITIAILSIFYALSYLFLFESSSGSQGHLTDYISSIGKFFYNEGIIFHKLRSDEFFLYGFIKFFLINAPLIILSLFNWRIAVVAFGSMIPNIFGDLGGAEKLGWSSHYHFTYIPFLIAAACIGYKNFYINISKNFDYYRKILIIFFLILHSSTINAYSRDLKSNYSFKNINENTIIKLFEISLDLGDHGTSVNFISEYNQNLSTYIPYNASVSTTENYVPSLISEGREIHLFPLNLGYSDFLVLPYSENDLNNGTSKISIFGAVSHLGKEKTNDLNNCLEPRIWDNYQIKKKVPYNEYVKIGILILEKNNE